MINQFEQLFSYPGIKQIIDAYNNSGFEIRFVGGCVRNILLNLPFDDIDFATNAHPDQSIQILEKNNIQVVATGLKHGTVTAFINKKQFEITTIRKDIECDGRHAEVEFTTDFKEDAARRDFTINAMSVSISGELFDYFQGQEDLAKGIIKFVGNPIKRVKEDYLRILRFYRFYSYYGKIMDQDSKLACESLAEKIKSLSGERIRSEFGKILISPNLINVLEMMYRGRVLKHILPITTLSTTWLSRLISICTQNNIPMSPLRNLIALINNEVEAIETTMNFWIKANVEKSYLKTLLKADICSDFLEQNLLFDHYKYGSELFVELYILKLSYYSNLNFKEYFSKVKQIHLPVLPIQGKDLIKKGIAQGKIIGETIKKLEKRWIQSNFTLSKDELLDFIK